MTTAVSSEIITAAPVISERQFLKWLTTALPGQSLTYHVGNLTWDREPDTQIEAAGLAAWGAHQSDKVQLIQRRIEPKICEYLATKKAA